MYEQARLNAVEELVVEMLRSNPGNLEQIYDAADEPIRFLSADDQSESARIMRAYQLTVRAAKRELLTRAKYPNIGPASHEVPRESACVTIALRSVV